MGTAIVLVAAAAAIGVGLVVYGTVRSQRSSGPEDSVGATYRTLADVREQLRRRFEPTGTPVWIASEQVQNRLQRDLVSADIELRPYEFRIIQLSAGVLFGIIGMLRFGFGAEFVVLAVIGYVLPSLYLRNRRGHRLRLFNAGLPRAMELIANSMKAGQSVAQSLAAVTDNAGPPVSDEFALARRDRERDEQHGQTNWQQRPPPDGDGDHDPAVDRRRPPRDPRHARRHHAPARGDAV